MPDYALNDPDLARGVELSPVQIWRDPESQNVVIQIEPGKTQAIFTDAQWRKAVMFIESGPEPPAEES